MSNTRDRIISTAMRLFAERGYNSTGVSDLRRESSVHSGSLYYAFPTKQDVLIAVLEAYRDGIGQMLIEPAWAGVDDPVERIFALLGAYRAMLLQSECTYGCPIGSLALELHEPDPPVRDLLAKNFDGWVDHVANCLEAAGSRFPDGFDVRRTARFVLTVMEGAVMQARTYRDIEAFDDCVAVLRNYFDTLVEKEGNGH